MRSEAQATMKAVVWDTYGPPDRLELTDVDKPVIGADGVLVRVRAASLNPADWRPIRGRPYAMRTMMGGALRRPTARVLGTDVAGRILGIDLAGQVEAVGAGVTQFKIGDEVFGFRSGALAEYVAGWERNFVLKPAGLTFEQAAAVPVAAFTALQALRDKGQVRSGQKVLINGASGGVGTFAVQLAKAFGAEVTGVCSMRNVEMVRAIGADHVIDYTSEDFTRSGERYDLIVDAAGYRSVFAARRVLAQDGRLVLVGAPQGRFLAPVIRVVEALLLSRFVSQKLGFFIARNSKDDLIVLKELIEAGKVTPVIDRTYPLSDTREAISYVEQRHARGKVVITM